MALRHLYLEDPRPWLAGFSGGNLDTGCLMLDTGLVTSASRLGRKEWPKGGRTPSKSLFERAVERRTQTRSKSICQKETH